MMKPYGIINFPVAFSFLMVSFTGKDRANWRNGYIGSGIPNQNGEGFPNSFFININSVSKEYHERFMNIVLF